MFESRTVKTAKEGLVLWSVLMDLQRERLLRVWRERFQTMKVTDLFQCCVSKGLAFWQIHLNSERIMIPSMGRETWWAVFECPTNKKKIGGFEVNLILRRWRTRNWVESDFALETYRLVTP